MIKTKKQIKIIKQSLKGLGIRDLKNIIISLTPKETCSKQDIILRDGYSCKLCGDKQDLQLHHIQPKRLGGNNSPTNLILLCNYCHWYLHHNPKFFIYHSKLVKVAYLQRTKDWGRPNIKREVKERIKQLRDSGLSLRQISKETNVSLGSVHKVTRKNEAFCTNKF